ncbi:MAG: ribbon-helix-helix protein, CopG family, partial [Desulfobacteria bacterium]
MITLRLDPKLEQDLNNTAKNLGLSKSELIRRSIHDYIGRLSSVRTKSPYFESSAGQLLS